MSLTVTLGRIVIVRSLVLMLEQNMLITITYCRQLVFILSPKFLSISVNALQIFSLRFGPKVGIHARMSFLLPFLLFPITQDLFLPIFFFFFSKNSDPKATSYLTFVFGYKRVFGSLQAGRSTRYSAIIETPGAMTSVLMFFIQNLLNTLCSMKLI